MGPGSWLRLPFILETLRKLVVCGYISTLLAPTVGRRWAMSLVQKIWMTRLEKDLRVLQSNPWMGITVDISDDGLSIAGGGVGLVTAPNGKNSKAQFFTFEGDTVVGPNPVLA